MLTIEQINEVNAAMVGSIQTAIIGFLTADPYLLSLEEATAASEEFTDAGADAFIAYFVETPDEETEVTEPVKSYRSNFAKSLILKAGARVSSATKIELAKAIEHASAIKSAANSILKTVKNLAENATTDDEKSALAGEIIGLRAEIESIKSTIKPNVTFDDMLQNAIHKL